MSKDIAKMYLPSFLQIYKVTKIEELKHKELEECYERNRRMFEEYKNEVIRRANTKQRKESRRYFKDWNLYPESDELVRQMANGKIK